MCNLGVVILCGCCCCCCYQPSNCFVFIYIFKQTRAEEQVNFSVIVVRRIDRDQEDIQSSSSASCRPRSRGEHADINMELEQLRVVPELSTRR